MVGLVVNLPSWLNSVQGDLLSLGKDHSCVGWTNGWSSVPLDVVTTDVWVNVLNVLLVAGSPDNSAQLLAGVAHIDTEGALISLHLGHFGRGCRFVALVGGGVDVLDGVKSRAAGDSL